MKDIDILKRLWSSYTNKFVKYLFISLLFSILVAASTSSIAWLLDPAIKKLFIEKKQSLIFIIPLAIIFAFAIKGISLYVAKSTLIKVGAEVSNLIRYDCIKFLE